MGHVPTQTIQHGLIRLSQEKAQPYSLRPKILVILGFKICPKKQVTLLYLESTCACKNQLVPNMGNKDGQT